MPTETPLSDRLDRRRLLVAGGSLLGAAALGSGRSPQSASAATGRSEWELHYCLNTSTIRERQLPLDQIVELTAEAGYDGIEPWIREIQAYQASGKSLGDLKKKIQDAGLVVESAIGFAPWIVDDEPRRREALELARRDMELVRAIGGTRIAAPPAGATRDVTIDLFQVAQRYRALLEVGREMGVIPQLEIWGFSSTLSRLGELALVATEAAHPDACVLADVYHIYKGGSAFTGLNMIPAERMHVFHINDYPAAPAREQMSDADRVYPGDGVAPLDTILRELYNRGFRGALSLELFNREYWKEDPRSVARTGLEKMKQATQQAFAERTQ